MKGGLRLIRDGWIKENGPQENRAAYQQKKTL